MLIINVNSYLTILCAGQSLKSHRICNLHNLVKFVEVDAINVIEATIVLGIWPLSLHSSMVDGH